MENIYNEPDTTPMETHLANNTRAVMAANLGRCQLGVETDTGRLGYTDADGDYHSATELTDDANKVKINESDTSPDVLENKIEAKDGQITVETSVDNKKLKIGVGAGISESQLALNYPTLPVGKIPVLISEPDNADYDQIFRISTEAKTLKVKWASPDNSIDIILQIE